MTTPAQARTDRAPNEIIDNDDINLLALVANRADTAAAAAQETAADALQLAQSIPALTPSELIRTDGTVARVVKLTQAQYDALSPKVATTLYVIV